MSGYDYFYMTQDSNIHQKLLSKTTANQAKLYVVLNFKEMAKAITELLQSNPIKKKKCFNNIFGYTARKLQRLT